MKLQEAIATLERLAGDPKFPKAAEARRAAAAAKSETELTPAELADLSARVATLEAHAKAKAEDEKNKPDLEEAKRKLRAVADDQDEDEEEREKARKALKAIEKAEKDTEARAIHARLTPKERELLASTEPTRLTRSTTSRGNVFSMPERTPSRAEAAARVEEIDRELGSR